MHCAYISLEEALKLWKLNSKIMLEWGSEIDLNVSQAVSADPHGIT